MLSKKLLKSIAAGALVLGFGFSLGYAAADDVDQGPPELDEGARQSHGSHGSYHEGGSSL